ncbi:MAG: adenylyltransferase/cytidyltransferase family protein [Candidatus Micrarchaeia archaeon]
MAKQATAGIGGTVPSSGNKKLFEGKIMEAEKPELAIVKRLFALQLSGNGISASDFSRLSGEEKEHLEIKGGSYCLKQESRKKLTVVMTGGVFDVLHAGHVFTLNEAAKLGNFLVAVVATDETAMKSKGKLLHPQAYRLYLVSNLKAVDIAMPGVGRKEDTLERVAPDIVVFGYDQKLQTVRTGQFRTVKLDLDMDSEMLKSSKIISSMGY